MAIKELFQDSRPSVLFDPRASQRIDPRFKFTRNGMASYYNRGGVLRYAPANQPRIGIYEPDENGVMQPAGLWLEGRGTNLQFPSIPTIPSSGNVVITTNAAISPDGTTTATLVVPTSGSGRGVRSNSSIVKSTTHYAHSFFYKPNGYNVAGIDYATGNPDSYSEAYIDVVSGDSFFLEPFISISREEIGNGWYRILAVQLITIPGTTPSWGKILCPRPNVPTARNQYFTHTPGNGGYFWGHQEEVSLFSTSYIPTAGSEGTRPADLLSIEGTSLPSAGSIYIDARSLRSEVDGTLLSAANASNDKLTLAIRQPASLYNSKALVYEVDGAFKPTLPFPVPTNARERNLITYGANNYHYRSDSSRLTPSSSSSVPADMNRLGIGHDVTDPTKAITGYINTVYLWPGELTPAVAEALVRNEIEAINADTYSPVGPAGALALVINTQGASTDDDKTFTLPAESVATDNDIVITWGDGTESGLNGAGAELGAVGLTHTYPAAGIYPVWVEGQMENIYYNNIANANDLVQITAWGTGDMFTAPSTMNSAFYGCTQMDFSSSARSTNLPDTSTVTNWYRAFRDCSSITGTFPSFTFTAATTFQEAWLGCSSMTSFVAAGNQTQNVTNFVNAWNGCSGLTSFPLINTSAGTSFQNAWRSCSSLTIFPAINTAAGTSFSNTWSGCSNLESFPSSINTAAGTNFSGAWSGCSSLDNIVNAAEATSFPAINSAAGTNFSSAWSGCSSFTKFPQITTSNGENFSSAWANCSSLASFPQLDTSEGTNFDNAWSGCSSLNNIGVVAGATTSFPLINTSKGTTFSSAWRNCSSLTSFPLINTAAGTNFSLAWYNNDGLTTFPALDFDAVIGLASDASTTTTGFRETWFSCDNLADFPANLFDNTTCTRYLDAFTGCALTTASIENIIVSINAAGTSNGNLSLQGGTNAGASTWTAAAVTAYNALVARGWTITRNA